MIFFGKSLKGEGGNKQFWICQKVTLSPEPLVIWCSDTMFEEKFNKKDLTLGGAPSGLTM